MSKNQQKFGKTDTSVVKMRRFNVDQWEYIYSMKNDKEFMKSLPRFTRRFINRAYEIRAYANTVTIKNILTETCEKYYKFRNR